MTHDERAEKLFKEALDDCLAIREERKLKYGNCWLQPDGVEAAYWGGIVNKYNRIKILHKNRKTDTGYESYEDCLRDLVILTLMTLACVKDEKDEK